MTFEDVAIYFSPEEWVELVAWQRELYQEVMMDNYDLVATLGKDALLGSPGTEPAVLPGWEHVQRLSQGSGGSAGGPQPEPLRPAARGQSPTYRLSTQSGAAARPLPSPALLSPSPVCEE